MASTIDPRKDVIVRVRPASRQLSAAGQLAAPEGGQLYDAFIYSLLPLANLAHPAKGLPGQAFLEAPLAGIEHINIQPANHREHLASFIEGESALAAMRDRLLESMSDGFRQLLTSPAFDLRIWWSSSAPELDDFPWELTANPGKQLGAPQVLFLRGTPPEAPIPVLPVDQAPRLAIVGAIGRRPEWVHQLCGELPGFATSFDLPIRDALRQAAREGFELAHVFSDGIVSDALEGILYDHDATSSRPELPPGELSGMLAGTRIAILALSRALDSNPDAMIVGGRSVVSAYRAFAYLGASTLALPTIVAPLGPIPEQFAADFWLRFYRELFSGWHLTRSLQKAQDGFSIPLPVALFCRHAAGRVFEPSTVDVAADNRRVEVRDRFLQSRRLFSELTNLGQKYGNNLPGSVREFMGRMEESQTQLRSTLDKWILPGEDV